MVRDKIKEIERIKLVRKEMMKRHGLTKTAFAEKLGFDLKAYNQIENRGANANYLASLHSAFGISSDYILSNIKSPF